MLPELIDHVHETCWMLSMHPDHALCNFLSLWAGIHEYGGRAIGIVQPLRSVLSLFATLFGVHKWNCEAINLKERKTVLENGSKLRCTPGPLLLKLFVEGLSSALFRGLDLTIFLAKPVSRAFRSQHLLYKRPLSLFVWYSGADIFGWPFYYGSYQAEFRSVKISTFFFVVSMRVKDTSHLKKLQIPLYVWIRPGHIKPGRTGIRHLLLRVSLIKALGDGF